MDFSPLLQLIPLRSYDAFTEHEALGLEGYGAYCFLAALLHDAGGRLRFDGLKAIARELHCSEEYLCTLITGYDFFAYDDTEFWALIPEADSEEAPEEFTN